MKIQTRWQDGASILIGLWLIFSPWVMDYTNNEVATTNARGLGVGIICFNLLIVFRTVDAGQEIVNLFIALWLISSPYVLGFQNDTLISINVIVAGVFIIGLALWEMFKSAKRHG